jgi:hypothetical protein
LPRLNTPESHGTAGQRRLCAPLLRGVKNCLSRN